MKIAIMGTGGVGGGYGARLAAAGSEVAFIARGKHLAAIQQNGLSIISPMLGNLLIKPAQCTDNPATIGPVDIVLFCVKLWDTESAAQAIKPMVGPNTAVISLQNGINRDAVLREIIGEPHIVGGVSYIGATIKAPGVIEQRGTTQKLVFGEYSGQETPRIQTLRRACQAAEIEAVVSADIGKAIWEKFIYLVAMSSVLAATRQTVGPVRANERTRCLLTDVMRETLVVGRAQGVNLDDSLVEAHMAHFDALAPDVTASMQYDLAIGNRLELPWLAGAVLELGKQLNVPTTVTRVLCDVLSPYANGTLSAS
jgi:2-dehydropantoate 2-reductase